jgi:thiazole synthase
LLNTAIAQSKNPSQMAKAMKLAVEAGYIGYKAGRMDQKYYAIPSSPFDQISS